MTRISLSATLSAGFCVLLALSCSGGGGGGTGATATVSTSSGVITGFGSIKLNGKEYQTQKTSFMVDGQSGSQNDLKVGMVVTVIGSLSSTGTRTATTITQEDVVEGAIQSIPATNDRLVVLGQAVLIDDDTKFDNTQDLTGLAPGNFVEVNGFVTGKGLIRATLIEKKDPPATVRCQVKGIVENHDSGTQNFAIGALTVNYAGASISNMPNPAHSSWNDFLVEVKGSPCDQLTAAMNAIKVEPERIDVANADESDVEGAITLFNSSASFSINGVPVVTNPNTIFEGGVASDLASGVEVKVEGVLSNGVLTAREVSFRDNVEIEGDAATVTSGGSTPNLTVSGLSGITVFVNTQTEFKGGISDLGQLVGGNHVRVRGRPTGTNTVIGTEIKKLSPATQVILEGAIQAVANPNVTVLGVLINTSGISDDNFNGPNQVINGRSAFFNMVQVGTLVKAQGTLTAGSVVWNEIEIDSN